MPVEPINSDERELARLLGSRLARQLQGLLSVGGCLCLEPDFEPLPFLTPRLDLVKATADVLANLVAPPGDVVQAEEGRRYGDELQRLAREFDDQMLAWSRAAPSRHPDAQAVAERLGEAYDALLSTLESYLCRFLLKVSFAREKELGKQLTQNLRSGAARPIIETSTVS